MNRVSLVLVLIVSISCFHFRQREEVWPNKVSAYPLRVAYIDRSTSWYGDAIAGGLGVPGYAKPHDYNVIALAFWSCAGAPKDMAMIWAGAATYFGQGNSFGKTTDQIQKAIKKIYNDHGIRVIVSAFGDSENPTSAGSDPVACGQKLGQFVKANNLDGADIDWEDNMAMNAGRGEDWLIKFTKSVRQSIPNLFLSHAPQAPYFKSEYYKNGAYITINKEVGSLIDFYFVQFYNQVDSKYDSYQELFIKASGSEFNGTSVKEIQKRGIPLKKIVVGKPILPSDASNTGWVKQTDLGDWSAKAFDEFNWYGGIMHWQYPSDNTGKALEEAVGKLKAKCQQTMKCR